MLISLLMEEADRQKAQRVRRQVSGKGKDEERDEVLAVTPSSSKGKGGKGGGKGGGKKNITCWNCGEKGHFKNKCPKPAKSKNGKEDSPDKKGTTSSAANTAESDSNSEAEGAWAIWDSDSDVDSDDDSLNLVPKVAPAKAFNVESDWFSKVSEGGCEADDEDWFTEDSDDSEEAFVAMSGAKPSPGAKLLDSGCTQHMFPIRAAKAQIFPSFLTLVVLARLLYCRP